MLNCCSIEKSEPRINHLWLLTLRSRSLPICAALTTRMGRLCGDARGRQSPNVMDRLVHDALRLRPELQKKITAALDHPGTRRAGGVSSSVITTACSYPAGVNHRMKQEAWL